MDKEQLQAKRNMVSLQIDQLNCKLKELDKQIEAIESGPVSAKEAYNKAESERHDLLSTFNDDEWFFEGFRRGEQNDRKRTRPLIDAVRKWIEAADESGIVQFGYNLLWHEFKTLEENEN